MAATRIYNVTYLGSHRNSFGATREFDMLVQAKSLDESVKKARTAAKKEKEIVFYRVVKAEEKGALVA